jgi:YD repeat-containing protein
VPKDGGLVTIDEFKRVTHIQDAAYRQFQFSYDNKTSELNKVTNEDGTWSRQIHHGKYTDEWKNERNEKWKGDIAVTPDGYSYTRGNERITCAPSGCQTKEYLSDGTPFYTDTTLLNGQHKVVDSRLPAPCPVGDDKKAAGDDKKTGAKISDTTTDKNGVETKTTPDGTIVTDKQAMKESTYDKEKHLLSVHDLKNNSQLNYDSQGHLTSFKDIHGQTTAFKDYDNNSNPHTIENSRGTWHKTGPDLWTNDQPAKDYKGAKTLHIHVQVNKDGYTYSDRSGATATRSADGSCVEECKGIKTTTDGQGKVTKELVDGSQLKGDTIKGSVQFEVKKGDTKSGKLNISGNDFEVVHAKGGDVHAHIDAAPNSPVGALQDGLVVYTYNHDPKVAGSMEQHSTSVIGMSQGDMDVINRFRSNNPNQDLVVMQCYDPKSQGVRYEIYAGLSLANSAPGARVKAGEVLGTAGDRGYAFAARKGRVSGPAVELTL